MKPVVILIALVCFGFTSYGQAGPTGGDTAPAMASAEDNQPKGSVVSAKYDPNANLDQFGNQRIYIMRNNPKVMPDTSKRYTNLQFEPIPINNENGDEKASITCNISWEENLNPGATKSKYQDAAAFTSDASINAAIEIPKSAGGFSSKIGTKREFTSTLKINYKNKFYDGALTCQIYEYKVSGKRPGLTQGELYERLKKVGIFKDKIRTLPPK